MGFSVLGVLSFLFFNKSKHVILAAAAAAAAAKPFQSCPTLCDPIDGSPPGSPVPGILQARVLESGDIAFSGNFSYHNPVFQNNSLFLHSSPSERGLMFHTASVFLHHHPWELSLASWPKMASPLSVFTQEGARWRIAPWEIYTLLLLISCWLELSHMAKFQFSARDTGKQFLFLATEEPGRLQSIGSQRVGHD